MLCGSCSGDQPHFVLECEGGNMPALSQNVPGMRSFMWQENMVLTSFV